MKQTDLFRPIVFPRGVIVSDNDYPNRLRDTLLYLYRNKSSKTGLILLGFIFFMSLAYPLIGLHSPDEIHLALKNHMPCSNYWFGTDELGRDLFSRVWRGAATSLCIGIIAALIDLVIGALYGAVSALFGGMVDEIMMRICDVLSSIPYLLMVILLMVVMGPGLVTIIVSLTLTGWINMARVTRAQIFKIKTFNYYLCAISIGASKKRIITKYFLPNIAGPIIATVTLTIPIAIFTEAFLSFLGLGVQAPISSLGLLAKEGLNALRYYPWRIFFPSLVICLTMLGFNLTGDGLRDILDPRLNS